MVLGTQNSTDLWLVAPLFIEGKWFDCHFGIQNGTDLYLVALSFIGCKWFWGPRMVLISG